MYHWFFLCILEEWFWNSVSVLVLQVEGILAFGSGIIVFLLEGMSFVFQTPCILHQFVYVENFSFR